MNKIFHQEISIKDDIIKVNKCNYLLRVKRPTARMIKAINIAIAMMITISKPCGTEIAFSIMSDSLHVLTEIQTYSYK